MSTRILTAATLAAVTAALLPAPAASAAGGATCSTRVHATGFHEHQIDADVAPAAPLPAGVDTVPSWSGSFTTDGVTYSYSMVGTDPGAGSATTTVPVVLVPLRLQFASDNCVQEREGMAADIASSPLFAPAPFRAGTTQYADAYQRGNFWAQVGSASPEYHVLLGQPDVLPTETLHVPAAQGLTVFNPYTNRSEAVVGGKWLQVQLDRLLQSLQIAPTTLAMFVDYNTYATDQNPEDCLTPEGCSFFYAYHGAGFSDRAPHAVNTYIYSSFVDYGDALPARYDAHEAGLSHEVLEWMDDPFVRGMRVQGQAEFLANSAPAWRSPFYAGGTICGSTLEVADPLEGDGTVFGSPVAAVGPSSGGTVFLLADGAYLSWFARQQPSTAIAGRYDVIGAFTTPSSPC